MLVASVRIEPGVSKRLQFDPQRLIPARGTVTDGAGAVVSAVSIASHTGYGIVLKRWDKADAQGAYTVRVLPQRSVLDPAYAAMTFGEGDPRRTLEPHIYDVAMRHGQLEYAAAFTMTCGISFFLLALGATALSRGVLRESLWVQTLVTLRNQSLELRALVPSERKKSCRNARGI